MGHQQQEGAQVHRIVGDHLLEGGLDLHRWARWLTERLKSLRDLEPVWGALEPAEKARVLALLVESVSVDVPAGEMEITFRPGAPSALLGQANEVGR